MKILVFVKPGEENNYVVEETRRLVGQADHDVAFVHMVPVPGDIPIDDTGAVLQPCTEFNLDAYHKQATKDRLFFIDLLTSEELPNYKGIVGRPRQIVEHQLETFTPDLVVLGSHHTTFAEDVFSASFAFTVSTWYNGPIMVLRPNQSIAQKQAALVCDFQDWQADSYAFLQRCVQGFNLTLSLACVMGKHDDVVPQLEKRMNRFTEAANLPIEHAEVLDVATVHDGVAALAEDNRYDVLLYKRPEHDTGLRRLTGSDLKDLINHGDKTLLIL